MVLFSLKTSPPGRQPRGQVGLYLLGLPLGVAAHNKIVSVPDQDGRARLGVPGMAAGGFIPDPCGRLQPVERHVHHQRADHAPNAMGNFCFEVTLGYRRLELPRRGERQL